MEQARRAPIRVAVLNDYTVVSAGVAAMLAPFRDRVEVVEHGVRARPTGDVDLVLYDTFGALRDPVEKVQELVASGPAKLVVYSWITDPVLVRRALQAGAAGFVPKTLDAEPLVSLLELIHSGEQVTPGPRRIGSAVTRGDWPGAELGLTARESEILMLIVRGLSNREIAEVMFLSINSVKTYIRTAYRKIGVRSRSQAVLWGVRHEFEPSVTAMSLAQPS